MNGANLDAFTRAYRARVDAARDGLELWSAVVRLTNLGERPVPVSDLAAALDRSETETHALLRRWGPTLAVEQGSVRHDHPAQEAPATRWRMTLGERTLYSEQGCAPDLFGIVAWLDRPMTVESACPATGQKIRVHLTPDGVTQAEPATTVVALIDPAGPRFAQADMADICSQQLFFASAQAGTAFLTHHPTGQLIPVGQFTAWARRAGLLWPTHHPDPN